MTKADTNHKSFFGAGMARNRWPTSAEPPPLPPVPPGKPSAGPGDKVRGIAAISVFSRRRAMIGAAVATFAGVGAVAVAAELVTVTEPESDVDAELLAACAVFMERQDILDQWDGDADLGEGVGEQAHAEWWDALQQIVGIPATTREGLCAKAEVLEQSILTLETDAGAQEDLASSLARDVLAGVAL